MAEPIDNETRAKIVAHYQLHGNASAAAREFGVGVSTAWRFVKAAREDGSLEDAGKELRARAFDAIERMMLSGVEVAHERLTGDWCENYDSADPGPQYLRAINDAHKTLCNAERLRSERDGEVNAGPVTIIVGGPDVATDDQGEPVAPSEAGPTSGS